MQCTKKDETSRRSRLQEPLERNVGINRFERPAMTGQAGRSTKKEQLARSNARRRNSRKKQSIAGTPQAEPSWTPGRTPAGEAEPSWTPWNLGRLGQSFRGHTWQPNPQRQSPCGHRGKRAHINKQFIENHRKIVEERRKFDEDSIRGDSERSIPTGGRAVTRTGHAWSAQSPAWNRSRDAPGEPGVPQRRAKTFLDSPRDAPNLVQGNA